MEFVQKKRSTRHTFTFHDEFFNFAYKEKSGEGDIDLHYVDMPEKYSVQIQSNDWLRNVGLLWIVIGVLQIGMALYSQTSLSGRGFWLVIGTLCVLWAYYSKVRYSVFQTDKGNVFVMQDKQHDKILEEVKSRKKGQLLSWYGEVNPDNDLENEIHKFKWLAEQQVITPQEAEQKIAQAELMQQERYDLPGERLN